MLLIYLGGSWAILEVVDAATRIAGLPEWTFPMASVLLLIGLPITLTTAYVQEGLPDLEDLEPDLLTPADVLRAPMRFMLPDEGAFTWRNAFLGGVAAALLLVLSVLAYLLVEFLQRG